MLPRWRRSAMLGLVLVLCAAMAQAVDEEIRCIKKGDTLVECNGVQFVADSLDVPGTTKFYIDFTICVVLVLFAGLMSGLTIGLLSFNTTELKVLQKGGEEHERIYAAAIIKLVERKHLLLVTLLLCNAACMEALPIYLDSMLPSFMAILVSVTAVLFFGEIIPQAICSRYGLAIGYYMSWPVKLLMALLSPVAWPISKLLDWILGVDEDEFYRREELKVLVNLHETNHEEPLTQDEVTIIKAVLDMAKKTVGVAMTPIEHVYTLDKTTIMTREKMSEALSMGHSRVPVYSGSPENIIGAVLVKNLILWDPDENMPLTHAKLLDLPTVHKSYPLYEMLNQFQTGRSHMALVREDGENGNRGQIVGIITLEDVIEEMIAEEIYDECDEHPDGTPPMQDTLGLPPRRRSMLYKQVAATQMVSQRAVNTLADKMNRELKRRSMGNFASTPVTFCGPSPRKVTSCSLSAPSSRATTPDRELQEVDENTPLVIVRTQD